MSGQKSCFTLVWGIQRGRGWEQGRAISFPGGGGRCGPQRPLSSRAVISQLSAAQRPSHLNASPRPFPELASLLCERRKAAGLRAVPAGGRAGHSAPRGRPPASPPTRAEAGRTHGPGGLGGIVASDWSPARGTPAGARRPSARGPPTAFPGRQAAPCLSGACGVRDSPSKTSTLPLPEVSDTWHFVALKTDSDVQKTQKTAIATRPPPSPVPARSPGFVSCPSVLTWKRTPPVPDPAPRPAPTP